MKTSVRAWRDEVGSGTENTNKISMILICSILRCKSIRLETGPEKYKLDSWANKVSRSPAEKGRKEEILERNVANVLVRLETGTVITKMWKINRSARAGGGRGLSLSISLLLVVLLGLGPDLLSFSPSGQPQWSSVSQIETAADLQGNGVSSAPSKHWPQ